MVSHDRAFLDRVVNRILEIDEHDHTASEFAGGWSDYVAARDLKRSHQSAAHEEFVAQRQELRDRVREQRGWAQEGVAKQKKKPRDKDKMQQGFFKNRTETQAAKVRISERALARLEANAVDKPWEGWELRLSLAASSRSGELVARLEGAVIERGAFRLGPVDLDIGWQERVALVGPNGCGKSSLLAAILGRLPLAAGTRRVGPGVVFGELDQARGRVAEDRPVLGEFLAATGLPIPEGRSLLAKFGLGADHVGRPAGQLSPGERTRLLLALLMAGGTNCLVLDEPTNHLDVPAIEQLEQALDTLRRHPAARDPRPALPRVGRHHPDGRRGRPGRPPPPRADPRPSVRGGRSAGGGRARRRRRRAVGPVAPPAGDARPGWGTDPHALLGVVLGQHGGRPGAPEVLGQVEEQPGEGGAVRGDVVAALQRPVGDLVQHHVLGAVAAGERDRGTAGAVRRRQLDAEEGPAGALAGAEVGDVDGPVVREALAPPAVGHDLAQEGAAVVEVRQAGAAEVGLGPVQAQALGVAQAPHHDEAPGRAGVPGRGEGKAELFHDRDRSGGL